MGIFYKLFWFIIHWCLWMKFGIMLHVCAPDKNSASGAYMDKHTLVIRLKPLNAVKDCSDKNQLVGN